MAKDTIRSILNSSESGLSRSQRRNASRLFKDEMKRVQNILAAVKMSGAGYPIDQELRLLIGNCNDELLEGAEVPFRNIWDVFVGFTKPEVSQLLDFVTLRPEKDHAFTALDFYAYATEEGLQEQILPRLRDLPEGVIHNYSALGDIKEVAFEYEGGSVVSSGISLVRYGEHLHWITLGGPVCDLEKVTNDRRAELAPNEADIRAVNRGASEEMIQHTLLPIARELPGTDDVWKSIAMGLFNLKTASHEIRILGRDWTYTLSIFSDQFEQRFEVEYEKNERIRRLVDKSVAQIEENSVFFNMAETLFALPAYFATKVSLVTSENVVTQLGASDRSSTQKYALKAPLGMRILHRNVSTLDFDYKGDGFDHAYTPPRFRVEVDGYWRRLKSDAWGKDATGNQIQGRTWVRGHARWKDKPPKMGVVHVKTPIRKALERAQNAIDKRGGEVEIRY